MHRPSAHMAMQGAADTSSGATPTAASQFQPSARPVPAIASPATARTRRSPIQDRNMSCVGEAADRFGISILCIVALHGCITSDGRIDLRLTLPDLVDLQGAGFLAGHPRRAFGHSWQRDPGDLRLFREQTVDHLDRDMTADDVA